MSALGPSKKRKTVACVIPVKNVEKIIRGALDSVAFCDEVFLVDMFSTDKTKAIALEYKNVKFIERQSYIYDNFNHGMDNATSEWIIRLDSDERLSPELQQEIIKVLEDDQLGVNEYDVFTAPYYSYFLGKAMMHGNKFGTREILFKKGTLRYPVKSEHDGLANIAGRELKTGTFHGPYQHYSCPSIKKYMDKINYYSEKDVERIDLKTSKVFSPWRILYICTRYFFRNYFRHQAYKDGYHGFCLAYLDAFYIGLNYLKTWEKVEYLKKFHDDHRDQYDGMLADHAKKCGYLK